MTHALLLALASHPPCNRPSISLKSALNAPSLRPSVPTIGTHTSLHDLRCTVGASQIPIAPADRWCPSHAVSFPGGFRTPAHRPWYVLRTWRVGPASETRHNCGPMHRSKTAALFDHLVSNRELARRTADGRRARSWTHTSSTFR